MMAPLTSARLKAHCAKLPGSACKLYAPPSNVLVYSVSGKTFAYFKTSEPERWRFSVRVTPDRFIELTDVPGIKPARYMARFHWVTIVKLDCIPKAYLLELLRASYARALAGLSGKRRAELLALSTA